MSEFDNASVEAADMKRQYRDHESTQARLAGRRKFQFCRRCGSQDGMQAVHRETLAEMTNAEIWALAPWHCAPWDAREYRHYACPRCNPHKFVPGDFVPVSTGKVLIWRSADPMSPDYAALAAEEPVS